jgi:hypothetical protein
MHHIITLTSFMEKKSIHKQFTYPIQFIYLLVENTKKRSICFLLKIFKTKLSNNHPIINSLQFYPFSIINVFKHTNPSNFLHLVECFHLGGGMFSFQFFSINSSHIHQIINLTHTNKISC